MVRPAYRLSMTIFSSDYSFPLIKKARPLPLPPIRSSMDPVVGDIAFARSNGIMGRMIRLGEWLRWKHGSKWNHVCFVSRIEGGVAYVIQAEPKGISNDKPLSSIGEYLLNSLPDGTDAKKVLEFATKQVGMKYSFLSIISLIADILTPNFFPAVRRDNTWICSTLVAESLRYGGWFHDWGDIYCVTPAQLYLAICNQDRNG